MHECLYLQKINERQHGKIPNDELYNEDAENTSQGANRSIFHTLFPSIISGEYRILSKE
ncbi:hypothetical protein HYC85_003470 [Camellia sinensis]|uniref:Uncharacterized protein n=1 Tax=Camellia sinensis TaxID=4442 RepID=A0A7J7HUS3_CAMSI|nr:hypothetical protein HYC85_003470 [Camellia sinensis]